MPVVAILSLRKMRMRLIPRATAAIQHSAPRSHERHCSDSCGVRSGEASTGASEGRTLRPDADEFVPTHTGATDESAEERRGAGGEAGQVLSSSMPQQGLVPYD